MGAFFLFDKDINLSLNRILNTFQKKGFQKGPAIFDLGEKILILYQKQSIDVENYLIIGDTAVFAVGTFVYKGLSYKDSLQEILIDFQKKNILFDKFKGNYFLILKEGIDLYFIQDKFSAYSVYKTTDLKVISSSFLSIFLSSLKKWELQKEAIVENLLTGSLIGPDTIVKDILRIERFDENLGKIKRFGNFTIYANNKDLNMKDSLNDQILRLKTYFFSIKPLAEKYGVSSGITGGFDSRMLMELIISTFPNYSFYSHWRKYKDDDFLIASRICTENDLPFKTIEVISPEDQVSSELETNLREACLFYDGNIRTETFWTEPYNTSGYRKRIVAGMGLELNGMGGEQYRNSERRILGIWNFPRWLKYDYLFKHSGECIANKEVENELLNRVTFKIEQILQIESKNNLTHLDLLRFINEVYNPANRLVRTTAENQLIFSLSPFADPILSLPAYNLIVKKGWGYGFQMELIERLNPSLASYKSSYGFSFIDKEPLKNKLITLTREILPFAWYNYLFRHQKLKTFREVEKKYHKYIQTVESLNLQIDLTTLINNSRLLPLVVSFGFFCNEYKDNLAINGHSI
jgi:hypothetical protein